MKIELAGNISLSVVARRVIVERAFRKLQRFQDVVDSVTITFDDVNGPKGGNDLRCQMVARLRGLPAVVVAKMGASVSETLCAIESVQTAITKLVSKRNQRGKRQARPDELVSD